MNFKLLKEPRMLLLIFVLIISLIAINPQFGREGVTIQGVSKDSAASAAGIQGPESGTQPVSKEVVLFVNGVQIKALADYYESTKDLEIGDKFLVETNKALYNLEVQPEIEIIELNETETIFVNETINGTNVTKEIEVPKIKENIIGIESLGLSITDVATSNIRKGLDLSGGTRVILKPAEPVTDEQFSTLLDITDRRLNAFGLSDIIVREATSGIIGEGDKFISVEIPGGSQKEVINLLSTQGNFEAKINNITVFQEGDDIRNICGTPDCSGVQSCGETETGWVCEYNFQITLSPEAAQRQADATANLGLVSGGSRGAYLEAPLQLILDGELVNELQIGEELRGAALTDIRISGPGRGTSRSEAAQDAEQSMKQMQTLLRSGSLPVKLDIVKTDQLSPSLGSEFTKNVTLIGILSIFAVVGVILVRYKNYKLSFPIIITIVSEAIIILGFASMIRWNIDLAAVAGIIIAIGTGVDHQIIIIDESIKKGKAAAGSHKERMKRAFFIIMAAYFTTLVAMIPLGFAGAGLLKGFAITTILGVSIGVFITRPAYAKMIEYINQ